MSARPQVLLLVSDPILQDLYRAKLGQGEYTAIFCETAARWREAAAGFSYDVIVLDLSLVSPARIEAIHAIQVLAPHADLIVLADHEDVRTAISAFRSGVVDYLLKPTNPETLHWSIAKTLGKQALGHSRRAADDSLLALTHQINLSESESQMRALVAAYLGEVLHSETCLWATRNAQGLPEFTGNEANAPTTQLLQKALGRDLFSPQLSQDSGNWYQDGFYWIPLRSEWMGAVFLGGRAALPAPESSTLAKAEFIIRHLETSLEDHRRFVEAKQLTYRDELTGLFNQRFLELSVQSLCRKQQPFGVLFLDIDKFKSVNDSHGHLVGTSLIIQLGKQLRKLVREQDEVYRYGGDEFIVVLKGIDLQRTVESAERLRREVEGKTFVYENKILKITLSVGVAHSPNHTRDAREILQLADEAMYGVKRAGRNQVFVAPPSTSKV